MKPKTYKIFRAAWKQVEKLEKTRKIHAEEWKKHKKDFKRSLLRPYVVQAGRTIREELLVLRRKAAKAKPVDNLAKSTAPNHSKSIRSSSVNPALKQESNVSTANSQYGNPRYSTQKANNTTANSQYGNPCVSATIKSLQEANSELDLRPSCSSARSTKRRNVSSNSAEETIANSTIKKPNESIAVSVGNQPSCSSRSTRLIDFIDLTSDSKEDNSQYRNAERAYNLRSCSTRHSKISSDSEEESIGSISQYRIPRVFNYKNAEFLDNIPSCSSKSRSRTYLTKHINISSNSGDRSKLYTATKYAKTQHPANSELVDTMPSAKVIQKISTANAQHRNPRDSEYAKIWIPQAITQSRNVWGSKSKGTDPDWQIDPRLKKMNTATEYVRLGPVCRKPPVPVAEVVKKLLISSPSDKSGKWPSSSSPKIEEKKPATVAQPRLKEPLVKRKKGRPSSWDKAQAAKEAQRAKEVQVAKGAQVAQDQGSKSPPPKKWTRSNDGGKAANKKGKGPKWYPRHYSQFVELGPLDLPHDKPIIKNQPKDSVMQLVPTLSGGEAPKQGIRNIENQAEDNGLKLVPTIISVEILKGPFPKFLEQTTETDMDLVPTVGGGEAPKEGIPTIQNQTEDTGMELKPNVSSVKLEEADEELMVADKDLEVGAEVEVETEECERDYDEISLFASDQEFDE